MADPDSLDLAGVDEATLRAWLLEAQAALHKLAVGAQPITVMYAQGDGTKSVTYSPARMPALVAHIAALKAQLGIGRGRRPLGVRF